MIGCGKVILKSIKVATPVLVRKRVIGLYAETGHALCEC